MDIEYEKSNVSCQCLILVSCYYHSIYWPCHIWIDHLILIIFSEKIHFRISTGNQLIDTSCDFSQRPLLSCMHGGEIYYMEVIPFLCISPLIYSSYGRNFIPVNITLGFECLFLLWKIKFL